MNMTAASLLYRQPHLYDALSVPDTTTITALIAAHRTTPAHSLLDVGCGTGNLLADLPAACTDRVGIDIQPGMVEHARRARPQLDFRVADMRTVQLGRSFDAITCVGMTLSYQHTLDDLQTTIDSIAAHADVGSVLVVQTLTEPIQHTDTSVTTTALYDRPVEIATTYEWRDPFVIMRRRWAFADGEIAEDHIRRRVWQRPELQARLSRAGLQLVDTRAGYLVCVVAATHL